MDIARRRQRWQVESPLMGIVKTAKCKQCRASSTSRRRSVAYIRRSRLISRGACRAAEPKASAVHSTAACKHRRAGMRPNCHRRQVFFVNRRHRRRRRHRFGSAQSRSAPGSRHTQAGMLRAAATRACDGSASIPRRRPASRLRLACQPPPLPPASCGAQASAVRRQQRSARLSSAVRSAAARGRPRCGLREAARAEGRWSGPGRRVRVRRQRPAAAARPPAALPSRRGAVARAARRSAGAGGGREQVRLPWRSCRCARSSSGSRACGCSWSAWPQQSSAACRSPCATCATAMLVARRQRIAEVRREGGVHGSGARSETASVGSPLPPPAAAAVVSSSRRDREKRSASAAGESSAIASEQRPSAQSASAA